jgi:hypothetical protein
MHINVARREHSSQNLLEDMPLNDVEAVFLRRIDRRTKRRGGIRPELRQRLEINRIDNWGILFEQMVNHRAIGGVVGGRLARGTHGEEKNDGKNEDSRVDESSSFCSPRAVASGK